MLVHVLDGDGITGGDRHNRGGGFISGPPSTEDPLREFWRPKSRAKTGDRVSTSLINRRHPDTYRCVVCGPEWVHLPAIVFRASEAVRERVTCWGWRDMSSVEQSCPGRAGSCDTAGCPPVSQWCSRADEKASNCYVGGDGAQMWPYCCVAFTELSAMLEMQDGHMPEGGSRCAAGECLRFDDDRAWYYNEVILDKWHRPWEPVLSDMIEAVAISPLASAEATAVARAVQVALHQMLGVDPLELPLLSYDHLATERPFALLDAPPIPPSPPPTPQPPPPLMGAAPLVASPTPTAAPQDEGGDAGENAPLRQIMRRYTAAAFDDDSLSSPDGKGVLIHQLDGWEDDDKPWLPCHSRTGRACVKLGDRISCMLIYESMGDREDRATIPLFSWKGGLVVRAEESKPLCLFGCDGATRNHNCPSHPATCVPGCGNPPWWCERERPLLANDCRCGLEACSGHVSAWRPSDVAFVMDAHEKHGPKYKFEPGFHTGYNEVVIESEAWEAHLPQVVQAFFFVDGGSDEPSIREMHARFLQEYGLTGRDCPLLRLDRGRWDEPFQVVVG